MSLRGAYGDLIVLSLFIGLIFTSVWTLYYYVVYCETFYLVIAFVTGLLFTLAGIARFVFVVEFWRAIVESSKTETKRELKRTHQMGVLKKICWKARAESESFIKKSI